MHTPIIQWSLPNAIAHQSTRARAARVQLADASLRYLAVLAGLSILAGLPLLAAKAWRACVQRNRTHTGTPSAYACSSDKQYTVSTQVLEYSLTVRAALAVLARRALGPIGTILSGIAAWALRRLSMLQCNAIQRMEMVLRTACAVIRFPRASSSC